jgi:hypothetical protein
VEQFNRLYGFTLVTSRSPIERYMRAFVEFVHDSVYLRLPDDAIVGLRCAYLEPAA